MREIRPYGSVRGVRRKPYPYRDILNPVQRTVAFYPAGGVEDLEGEEPLLTAPPEL